MDPTHNSIRTLCVHGGRGTSDTDTALAPAIQLSSTYVQTPETHALTAAGAWDEALVYSRYGNPTVAAVEARLAALEGAPRALLFGSGTAAMHAGILALAQPGSRVAYSRQIYGGTLDILRTELRPLGFGSVEFDLDEPETLRDALADDVSLVVCESVSNPILTVADLPRIAELAHANGSQLLVDATFASPVLQRPLTLGADLVMHSATKYLGGHSDLTAGSLAGDEQVIHRAWQLRKRLGAILDPHSAFLLDRGLKTLALRVQAQSENAAQLSRALSERPEVIAVHYPPESPHLVAGGGVIAFEIAGGDEALRPFVSRLKIAQDAPSLGGVETLVSLPVFMSHVGLSAEERERAGIRPGLVRVAVGIEDGADLVADFVGALTGRSSTAG